MTSMPIPWTSLHRGLEVRELAALRAAGRLGLLTVPIARVLVYADRAEDASLVLLRRLTQRGLLVRVPLPRLPQHGKNRPPPNTRAGYMLTPEGRDLLALVNADPPETLSRLVVRDRKAEGMTDAQGTLQRFYAGYCAAIIAEMRRAGKAYAGAVCQRAYSIAGENGAVVQTIGAVLTVYLDPKQGLRPLQAWDVGWLDGEGIDESWVALRLAVEIDLGLSAFTVQFAQAQTYARLMGRGVYRELFEGDPRPVVIVPAEGNLVKQVGQTWAEAWPKGPTLIADAAACWHPQRGPLWGCYQALASWPTHPATLLAPLGITPQAWAAVTAFAEAL